jgi:hypothetical protein
VLLIEKVFVVYTSGLALNESYICRLKKLTSVSFSARTKVSIFKSLELKDDHSPNPSSANVSEFSSKIHSS